MRIKGKSITITGAARGIGKSLAHKFFAEGARIAVVDIDYESVRSVAKEVEGIGLHCDVTDENQIKNMISRVELEFGQIDIFVSNAGVYLDETGHAASASNETWKTNWELHVMSHVYAARSLLPGMIQRKNGYFIQVISAAALLSQVGNAAYSATKQAALGFAESMAISHKSDGINVSVVCPQYVATEMLGYPANIIGRPSDSVFTPNDVADAIVSGVKSENFLILPHSEVFKYMNFKSNNYQKWIDEMVKLREKSLKISKKLDIKEIHKYI